MNTNIRVRTIISREYIGAARVVKNTPMFVCAAGTRTDGRTEHSSVRADGADIRDRAEDHLTITSMVIQGEADGLKLVMTHAIRIIAHHHYHHCLPST